MAHSLLRVAAFGALVAIVTAPTIAQSPPQTDANLRFEVASVKPNKSGEFGGSFGTRPGGQLIVQNNSLRNMIRNAYDVQGFQIVGGPAWIDGDKFDITAKAAVDNPSREQLRAMVRALLADRFKLVAHRETRQMPIYAIVLARPDGRLGPRLTRSETNCAALTDAARRGGPPPGDRPNGSPQCGTRSLPGRLLAGGVSMADLARNLANFAGRTTVDRTGLTGAFDLELEYTPDQLPPGLPADLPAPPKDGPSLFTAVQEQLGLRLDSQRGPVDVLVIDSAEPPTPD